VARILIAEPTPALHQLLEQVVTDVGHEPVDATGVCEQLVCDALILEPDWPGARRLAECLRHTVPTLPVVCVSKRSTSSWATEFGVDAYLVKPFTLQDLEEAIAASVGRPKGA
jgi:DNA-binding response OmpR family regulator